jgi:hypothetical protein
MPTMTTPAERYGVNETNGLFDGNAYHQSVDYADAMTLAQVAAAGGKITRLRILGGGPSDGFYADISYIHATLPDGRIVPLHQDYPMCFPIRTTMAVLIEWAKEHKVYAKGLGLLDKSNWSVLS